MSRPRPVLEHPVWWGLVARRVDAVVVGVLIDLAPGQLALFYRGQRGGGNLIALESLADTADLRLASPPLDPFRAPVLFGLDRRDDRSGVSGQGLVAVGAVFEPYGTVALAWLGQTTGYSTLTKLPCLDAVRRIHGHGGTTDLVRIPTVPAGDAARGPFVLAGEVLR
jgi:hypothetical protein